MSRRFAEPTAAAAALAREMRLLTNNPAKRAGLEGYGLSVRERVPLITMPVPENVHYLETKQRRLGHRLQLGGTA